MESAAPIPLLSARNLRAVLPAQAGSATIFDDVTLTVRAREIVDIGGPSGAGKTTLLRALARLLPGVTGELRLAGVLADGIEPAVWRSRVALLPQKPAIVPGSVRENLLLPWNLKVRESLTPPDDGRLANALGSVELSDIELDRDAARLSVGQQARVVMVRVALTAPEVLLLDEPDAALDEVSATAVREGIRRFAARGGAVLRVRHRADDGLALRRLDLAGGRLGEVAR